MMGDLSQGMAENRRILCVQKAAVFFVFGSHTVHGNLASKWNVLENIIK